MSESNQRALLRLKSILAPEGPIPCSKSTWWAGVRDGRFPQPVRLGGRITTWKAADIEQILQNGTLTQTPRKEAARGE